MNRRRGLQGAVCALAAAAFTEAAGGTPVAEPPSRIEARSADLLAVGLVHGDRMSIHVSRLVDNAPVRDAAVTVLLRGVAHPTVTEADGSYSLETHDLEVPGTAAVEYQIAQGEARERLVGTLTRADGEPKTEDRNSSRQLWWWVLNFAVCIGFLMLWSKRRKASTDG